MAMLTRSLMGKLNILGVVMVMVSLFFCFHITSNNEGYSAKSYHVECENYKIQSSKFKNNDTENKSWTNFIQ